MVFDVVLEWLSLEREIPCNFAKCSFKLRTLSTSSPGKSASTSPATVRTRTIWKHETSYVCTVCVMSSFGSGQRQSVGFRDRTYL